MIICISINNLKAQIINLCIKATTEHSEFSDWFAEGSCYFHRRSALDFFILVLLRKQCAMKVGKKEIRPETYSKQKKIECTNPKLKILKP